MSLMDHRIDHINDRHTSRMGSKNVECLICKQQVGIPSISYDIEALENSIPIGDIVLAYVFLLYACMHMPLSRWMCDPELVNPEN